MTVHESHSLFEKYYFGWMDKNQGYYGAYIVCEIYTSYAATLINSVDDMLKKKKKNDALQQLPLANVRV